MTLVYFFKKLSQVTQIHIIGTSLGGVDMPYFNEIKESTEENTIWNIYCHYPQDMSIFVEKIKSLGVNEENIIALDTSKFFDFKKP
ncbi:AbiH family protein [Paenibacillus sp. 7516]|uniref:AbiH family protein n=1 Tax=Paenibacillus sp. 7516 TaxID=2022549 RepID=UPI0024B3C2F1|nr:AbiH family protein [Paenibacillus sp. 7516]